jgi:hypothetical protein
MHLLSAVLLAVTIRIYDSYGVPTHDVDSAIRMASATLAAAGITTEWIRCTPAAAAPDRCGNAGGRLDIVVRISRAPDGRDGGEELGEAAVDTTVKAGTLATLYADRITSQAAAAGVDQGTLLGRAAAHEIGHLLMGTTAHTPQGVMRARWSRWDLQRRFGRDWQFSSAEAEKMQMRVAARADSAATERHSPICVLRSAFSVRRSPFSVLRSPFGVRL